MSQKQHRQHQSAPERAPEPARVERAEPAADLVASWIPPVPTRWSAGYDYVLDVPAAVRRACRGIPVYPVAYVVGRGRAEWALLSEDNSTITCRLAGLDLRQLVVRLHRVPTGGTPERD